MSTKKNILQLKSTLLHLPTSDYLQKSCQAVLALTLMTYSYLLQAKKKTWILARW